MIIKETCITIDFIINSYSCSHMFIGSKNKYGVDHIS